MKIRTLIQFSALAALLPMLVGCGGGGGGTAVGASPAPVPPAAAPNAAPTVTSPTLTISDTSGGAAGSVDGTSITLPIGGGTLVAGLTAFDPDGSLPVVVFSVFNNNTGATQYTQTVSAPTAGNLYQALLGIGSNVSGGGLAVTYLISATATDASGKATSITLGTVLVPGASSPPIPPPPANL